MDLEFEPAALAGVCMRPMWDSQPKRVDVDYSTKSSRSVGLLLPMLISSG